MDAFDPQRTFELIEREVGARLQARGYAITKQDFIAHAEGTRYTIFSRPSGHVRLTWDGRAQKFILRSYRKGSAIVRTLRMTLLGRHDLDKLEHETIVRAEEWRSLGEEEWIRKFTDKL
ncbi:hypothetical protein [Cohnella candidum]|uniref:Uncharacterized protein n=1 Tax=Cohnella candidum TaxID=2674991 RepID=A0A3G3JUZ2_9BACL|nr:hypothetical protein [Cohnella candidum]AYQ72068.1 hypothetical protein EAV92_05470 [Cohnella candidum]